jgi:Flp pilus assembly protein TadG
MQQRPGGRRPSRSLIRRFRKNEKGSTSVEFAMVSVPFLGLLFAIFESAYVFFVTESLESAVNDAGRTLMTGQNTSSYTSATGFRDGVVCAKLPSFITCSNVTVDVRTAGTSGSTSFSGANTYASTAISSTSNYFCPGSQGDVVVMRVMYDMPVYLPMLVATSVGKVSTMTNGQTNVAASGATADYRHRIIATSVFRNEPYGSTTISSTCSSASF